MINNTQIIDDKPVNQIQIIDDKTITQRLTIQEPVSPVINQALNQSIKPSIDECERFFIFLNNNFHLGLNLDDLIVLIHETSPSIRGFFRSVECSKIWNSTSQENSLFKQQEPVSQEPRMALNSIVLSSHILAENGDRGFSPYTTLTHEFVHYVNFVRHIKDCSKNQYHNKKFKELAEKMLLIVEQDVRRGYCITKESDEFKKMLIEFKPSPNAFKIFQDIQSKKKKKAKGRLLLFICGCGQKIRASKNVGSNCDCRLCETQFQEQEQESEGDDDD
jgi:hypothetical protein